MIKLENIQVKQGAFELRELSVEIPQGAYAVLMGASGSGKTTLVELLCGLRFPQRGRVMIGGRDMTHAVPAAREVGYVPQDGALFKTMTVRGQLGFALDLRHFTGHEVNVRVREIAEMLDIAHLLDRYPGGLSGGERQRTALGRALSFRPKVLLLDEPLSALDDETRKRIMALLRQIQQQTGVTTLHVTHSRHEAEELGTMGMKIAEGRIVPLELNEGRR